MHVIAHMVVMLRGEKMYRSENVVHHRVSIFSIFFDSSVINGSVGRKRSNNMSRAIFKDIDKVGRTTLVTIII